MALRCFILSYQLSCADREGGGGAGDQKNHKNVGFLTNTGPDPLKNYKVAKPVLARGDRDSRAN